MRSLLFVPGDSERKLEKGLSCGADVVIVDLEDSVAPQNKAAARKIAADFIAPRRGETSSSIYVRVNDLSTGLTDDDLAGVVPRGRTASCCRNRTAAPMSSILSLKLRVHEAENGLADGGIDHPDHHRDRRRACFRGRQLPRREPAPRRADLGRRGPFRGGRRRAPRATPTAATPTSSASPAP